MKTEDNQIRPPKWAIRFLNWICPLELYETIEGDLVEQFELDVVEVGFTRARSRFLRNVLKFVRPGIIFRHKLSYPFAQRDMLQSYLKISYRHLIKNKSFSLINISGLAVGMAAAFMIVQYISFETSYDRYHKNSDRIYRICHERILDGVHQYEKAQSFIPMGEALKNEYPEVDDYVTLFKISDQSEITIRYQREDEEIVKFSEENVYHVKGNFFNLFSLPLVAGTNSLEPKTVIISSSIAKKYFGNVSPLEKVINHSYNGDYKIVGVFEDAPANSHLKPDFLFAWETVSNDAQGGDANNWHWDGFYTYILLTPGSNAARLQNFLPEFTRKYLGNAQDRIGDSKFRLQPLTEIHLKSHLLGEVSVNGNSTIVDILKVLALFVLAMAYINYTNLSAIKAMDRAKEIGVRKVIGSNRRQLIAQFLLESFMINIIAAVVAAASIFWLENAYQSLVGQKISAALLEKKEIWIALTSLLIVGSIASGLYPAFLISSFKPVKVLKGKFAILGKSSSINPRRVMVTFQFVLAMILITGCAVIYKQIKFLQDKDLGLDINETLVLRTFVKFGPPGSDSVFINKLDVLKNALLKNKSIKGTTASYDIPGKEHLSLFSNFRSVTNSEELISLYYSRIDYEFIPLFNVRLVAGRNFSKDILTDQHAIIINLEALKAFGFANPGEAIDHEVTLGRDPDHLRTIKIIGVVGFRSISFKEKNYPVVYQINWAPLRFLSIKFEHLKDRPAVSQNLRFIKQEWEQLFPEQPFDYFFLDEFFNKQYEADKNFSKTLTSFTCLAIFIACLGLYGLSSLVTTHRAKEIGIRKILGAPIRTLFLMLIGDFGMLILVAGGISFPVIWYALTRWLQTYAYSTELSWWVFLMPVISMLIIVFITVGQQALKTTLANPVDILKDE